MAAKEVRLRPSRPSRPVAALVLALLASSAAARADGTSPAAPAPPTPLESALAAKEWSRALPLAEEAAEGAGQAFAEALYRVARVRAFLGQRTEALDALERAHGAGLFDASALRKDGAFAALVDDARFQALAKAVRLKGYLWLLERKERDADQKPDEVMRALALKPGERIADVGAGSGYFTLRLARAVGPSGSVLAVDANADLLAHLDGRLKQAGLTNARTLLVQKDDP